MSSLTNGQENRAVRLSVQDGLGRLTFDLPGEKVNKLSAEVMESLSRIVDA